MKFLTYLSTILLLALQLNAQQKTEFSKRPAPDPAIRNLKVGDKVPEISIPKIIRNDRASAKTSDFNNQLLILDFFDTFCGSCIEALPKLDSLQRKFGNRIKILPVSYQSEAVMTDFFNNNRFVIKNKVNLPCVVEDKVLGSYFQYKLISHEVWIYKGKVVAITGTDYVTTKNIQIILDGKAVSWPVKNDMVNFDPKKPIFVQTESDQYNNKNNIYSGITGHRNGIDFKGAAYDTLNVGYRFYNYNRTILQALTGLSWAATHEEKMPFIPHPERYLLHVKDKSKYIYTPDKGFASDWYRENDICYEMISTKPMTEKERWKYIYSDLQNKLGLSAKWEKRLVKCLVITKTENVDIDSLNKIRKGQKLLISTIPLWYFDQSGEFPPAIDETGLKASVIIEDGFKNLDQFKQQLRLYGLGLIEAEREIDVLVITENDIQE